MWRAVALLDSSFFASWRTLLAGYCCRSAQPSFSVLDTNSSSFRKTKICLVGGYWQFLVGIGIS